MKKIKMPCAGCNIQFEAIPCENIFIPKYYCDKCLDKKRNSPT